MKLQQTSQKHDKSSDIEQQPPFGDGKYSNTLPQKRGGEGVQNQLHFYYAGYLQKNWRCGSQWWIGDKYGSFHIENARVTSSYKLETLP